MKDALLVQQLIKEFRSNERPSGRWRVLRGLFKKNQKVYRALDGVSFSVEKGERVAFIGPNGAGKSTTIKILTGILHPTSGEVQVLGKTPWKERRSLGYQIGTVFGQRSQLWYHLPPLDTFKLLSKVYEIEEGIFKSRLKELIALFEIQDYLQQPVRQLSLGQRMRCELVASLLHHPEILFLDEPTIGLDIHAKLTIRTLLNRLSKERGLTLFLTSHDPADIEQVCDRVLVLDHGRIVTDQSLKELRQTYQKRKQLSFVTEKERIELELPGLQILENGAHFLSCEVDLSLLTVDRVIQLVLEKTGVKDLSSTDPSMEEIVRLLYASKR